MGALVKGGALTKIAFAPVAPGPAEVRRARAHTHTHTLSARARLGKRSPSVAVSRGLRGSSTTLFCAPLQVRVRVLFCGMCHSDCHKIDDDWHDHVKYPMVRSGEDARVNIILLRL